MRLRKDFIYGPFSILLILFGAVSALVENNLALLVSYGLWFLLGILIIIIAFPKVNRQRSIKLFLLFFVIYYLYMYITNSLFVANPYIDYFRSPDEPKFYQAIETILRVSTDPNMFDKVLYNARQWHAFGVITWFMGRFAYMIDVNSLVVQKLQMVFLAAMITVLMYNMARIYFDEKKSWIIAISYGLFTHLFFYSAIFMRDIHISCIYIVGFYILLRKKNLFNLALLGGLCFLAWKFRAQHGIFFLGFIGIYLFLYLRNNRKNLAILFLCLTVMTGAASALAFYAGGLLGQTTGEMEHYQEYHGEKLKSATGFGATLSGLPPGVRQGTSVIMSQLSAFPFYAAFYSSVLDTYRYWYFPLVIAALYWLIVWGFVFHGLLKPRLRKSIPIEVKCAFLLAALLILAAGSSSSEERRIMCVYPVIYLVGGFVYYSIPKMKRKFIIKRVFLLYGGLMLLYFGAKMVL